MIALIALLALAQQQDSLEAKPPAPPPRAAQTPAPLTPPQGWVTQRDYPKAARGTGARGETAFRLTVDAEGRAVTCTITASSGFQLLDDQTCQMLRQRARFKPARDGNDNPIPFTWNSWFVWELPR